MDRLVVEWRESDGALTPTDPLTTIRYRERTMAKKKCTKCCLDKPISAFYTNPKNGRTQSWCRACNAESSRAYFAKHRPDILKKRGPYNAEWQRRFYKDNPEARDKSIAGVRAWWNALPLAERRRLNQRKKLLKRYGITVEQWEQMRAAQKGLCAICGESQKQERHFHVDHCHDTGRIRGLLCMRCNTSLSWFEKVSGRLEMVLSYLGIEQGL